MKIYRTLQTALNALRRNVMRSVLTTLGIIIGVAAVIAMMEIGHGTSSQIQKTIASMGANNLLVLPGTAASGGVSFGSGSVMTLTPQDCDAIIRDCPAVRNAAPIVNGSGQVIYGGKNWVPASIVGTTPAYLDVREWALDHGALFTDQDVRNGAKVCILGRTITRELFGAEDPVGKELRLQNVNLRVVGVLEVKGANTFGRDQDDVLMAPWTTMKFRVSGNSSQSQAQSASSSSSSSSSTSGTVNSLSSLYPNSQLALYPAQSTVQAADTPLPVRFTNVGQILCAASSSDETQAAVQQITSLLHERHHLRPEQDDDFQIRDMTEIMNAFTSTSTLMTNLLLIVAAISLVVGGVGIMNIMLVSVTERTREIGLRMAVGARARDILRQFLVEAVALCLAGGFVGILLGRGSSLLVRELLHWPTAVSVPAIVASVIVSATVGIVFGYYPAWKASRLDPIEALRFE